MSNHQCLPHTIMEVLGVREPRLFEDSGSGGYRHAGVLFPLLEEDGICKVLFTKRTHKVEHHKGQISFPGGAVERGDRSFAETALRETFEEVGLAEDHIEVLGSIDDALTLASNYVIHPLVGLTTSMDGLAINRAEVRRLIKAPLSLFHSENREKRVHIVEYEGVTYRTPAYGVQGDLIWGATACMIENFMDIVGEKLCLPPMKK